MQQRTNPYSVTWFSWMQPIKTNWTINNSARICTCDFFSNNVNTILINLSATPCSTRKTAFVVQCNASIIYLAVIYKGKLTFFTSYWQAFSVLANCMYKFTRAVRRYRLKLYNSNMFNMKSTVKNSFVEGIFRNRFSFIWQHTFCLLLQTWILHFICHKIYGVD